MAASPSIFFTRGPSEVRGELWNDLAWERAKELGYEVRFNEKEGPLESSEWAELLEGVDALMTTWGAPCLDSEVLCKNDTLKIVGHAAGSVGTITSPELYERNIKVVTANPIMAAAVAEWSLMATMMGLRSVIDNAHFGSGHPMTWGNQKLIRGIYSAVIGIWGFGDISRQYLEMVKRFSPREILVCSGHLGEEEAAELGMRKVTLEELFAESDVINCLAALTEKNKYRVNAEMLRSIKDRAVLINCGRAYLIRENDLLEELSKERFNAILDVHYEEPLGPESAFHKLDNVIMTPHCAGRASRGLYVKTILDEFDRFFRGEPLKYEVPLERAKMMTVESLRKK